jgi:phosphatidylserine/phosphatidylglycerophosphate/cardiolipin synthase-like enzyme
LTVVLVSSANWSGGGVVRHRDAGLIIHDEEIAGYYQRAFLDDWNNRAKAQSRVMLQLALLRVASRCWRNGSYALARLFWLKPTK